MATVTLNSAYKFTDKMTWLNKSNEQVDAHNIYENDNSHELNFIGNFTFSDTNGQYPTEHMTSGTINSIEYHIGNQNNMSTVFSITGLNLDAISMASYFDSGVQAVFAHVLSGDDEINGSAGNDALLSYAGNDEIRGGTGNDQMFGGAGNDIYYVAEKGDKVTENANEGTDTVLSSVTYKLGKNIENLTLTAGATDGTGNDDNNILMSMGVSLKTTLNGGKGNDTIYSTGYNDLLIGGAGNDIFVAAYSIEADGSDHFANKEFEKGDTIIKDFTNGQDTIDLSAFNTNFTIVRWDDEETGVAYAEGELGVFSVGTGTLIIGNAIGGNDVDVVIYLSGVKDADLITAEDFISTIL